MTTETHTRLQEFGEQIEDLPGRRMDGRDLAITAALLIPIATLMVCLLGLATALLLVN